MSQMCESSVEYLMRADRNVHKFTWTSPDGNTHNQIDHILIDRRRHSSVLDVRCPMNLMFIWRGSISRN
jgi:hypothetical protein